VLQLFLSSPKATLRFAAIRTLSQVAMTHPLSVTTCNLDMENLITDTNRSIATLAITTLLKVRFFFPSDFFFGDSTAIDLICGPEF
jgi:coatomer protein complex subunit gamma